ncbi:hypothetical protein JW835_14640 [bacterium]|nr:hypothetical protein [bacterium]
MIVQFGLPPNRIDLINQISDMEFHEAWESAACKKINTGQGFIPIYYMDLKHLIANKEAAGRDKDLDDLKYLRKLLYNNSLIEEECHGVSYVGAIFSRLKIQIKLIKKEICYET